MPPGLIGERSHILFTDSRTDTNILSRVPGCLRLLTTTNSSTRSCGRGCLYIFGLEKPRELPVEEEECYRPQKERLEKTGSTCPRRPGSPPQSVASSSTVWSYPSQNPLVSISLLCRRIWIFLGLTPFTSANAGSIPSSTTS